jgi:hypothetical protein
MPIDESQLTPQQRQIYDTLHGSQKRIYLDLSDEVRDIVGRWAPPNGCTDDQKLARVCQPDPRVTAQVGIRRPTDWDLIPAGAKQAGRVASWRIKGARKGNLLLTPGGPSGIIGALLSALAPPQDYSHMGIVIADDGDNGTLLRHCTASEDWLTRKVFMTGTIFDDTPLEIAIPLRGFRPDAVKHLWPGTITQTVEVAFKSHYHENYRAEVYELDAQGNYLWQQDEFGEKQPILREKYSVLDPVRAGDDRGTGRRYRIPALTFDPVFVPEMTRNGVLTPGHWADPLIVQPCAALRTPAVDTALSRIADACLQLRGHYRYFAYTHGRISENADGPVTLEGMFEPLCRSGQWVADPVDKTRGMVCSTFIWQAVQLANEPGGGPRIVLDGRPARVEPTTDDDRCARLTAALGRKRGDHGSLDPADPTDGLYFYSEAGRKEAAGALQSKLRDKVMQNVGSFLDEVAGPPWLGALGGAYTGSLISQMLAVNPLTLATVLGVSVSYIESVVEDLRKTATHVSNQHGDCFRGDNAALDNESDDWRRNPGAGNTVSPDDILNAWSAPQYEDDNEVVGVYGANIKAEVLSPGLIDGDWKPSTWEVITDRTSVGVRVYRPDVNGQPEYLTGATVHIGCRDMPTTEQAPPDRYQRMPSVALGQYFGWATWIDPSTGWQWKSPRQVVSVPGSDVEFKVFPPKQSRRTVSIAGKADLLIRHASDEIPVIGTIPWERNADFYSGWTPMTMDFSDVREEDDPEFFAWLQENYGPDLKGLEEFTWQAQFEMTDTPIFPAWGLMIVRFTCKLDSTGTLHLTIKGGSRPGLDRTDNTEPQWGEEVTQVIPPKLSNTDPGATFDVEVTRTNIAVRPVIRATLHVSVHNNQQGG